MQDNKPLTPLEDLIAGVIALHPEYHELMDQGEEALDKDWLPEGGETNPFLHMGMHIAIREQLGANRPQGIREAHAAMTRQLGDGHAAEHEMLEALGETMWEAQRNGVMPDESIYLDKVKRRIKKGI